MRSLLCPPYNFDRVEAETFLNPYRSVDGHYILRSNDRSELCVSVTCNGAVKHFRVQADSQGKLSIGGRESFPTVDSLISGYKMSPLKIKSSSGVVKEIFLSNPHPNMGGDRDGPAPGSSTTHRALAQGLPGRGLGGTRSGIDTPPMTPPTRPKNAGAGEKPKPKLTGEYIDASEINIPPSGSGGEATYVAGAAYDDVNVLLGLPGQSAPPAAPAPRSVQAPPPPRSQVPPGQQDTEAKTSENAQGSSTPQELKGVTVFSPAGEYVNFPN